MSSNLLNPDILTSLLDLALPWLGQIILALLLLTIGWYVINWLTKIINTRLLNHFDKNLAPFLGRAISLGLRILLITTVLSTIGVETTTFATIIGALGVGIGLALSGMTQNFAAAILIFVNKPFTVGDQIQLADEILGEVKKIRIFNTLILRRDRTYAWIPNANLTQNSLINFYQHDTQRFEVEIGISYDADHETAEKLIRQTIQKLSFVLATPKVQTGVTALADSSVVITALFYAKPQDFLKARLDIYGPVKKALDKAGIEIPYPQVDVHRR